MPITSQGLYFPQRERVRSMILPMIGSFRASNTRAPIIMAEIAPSCAAFNPRVKRINVKIKLVNRL